MKRIKLLATLTLFSAVLFTSCGDTEPVDEAVLTGNANDDITGTYRLTAFNTDVQTDLNRDGNKSTNQMTETTCFNNSLITLNEDGTFTADSKGVDISQTETLTCFTDTPVSGTWTYVGSTLSLTYTEDGLNYTDTFSVSGNQSQLTFRDNDGIIVGIPIDTPEFLSSGITMIYTKQ